MSAKFMTTRVGKAINAIREIGAAELFYADFTKHHEPQGSQPYDQMNEVGDFIKKDEPQGNQCMYGVENYKILDSMIKPGIGLQPEPVDGECCDFWQGGDFNKDEPQDSQHFSEATEIDEVVEATVRPPEHDRSRTTTVPATGW